MTAQTPAAKAGGVSALLACLSPKAPLPEPLVQPDFLSVILNALTTRTGKPDAGAAAQPSNPKPSPPPAGATDTPAAEVAGASLLLALLAPPPLLLPPQLPPPAKPAAHKPLLPAGFPAPSTAAAPEAPAQQSEDPKPAKSDAGGKPPALAAQSSPTDTAPEEKSAKPVTEKATPLPARPPVTKPAAAKPPSSSGTSVAMSSQRMNYMAERNEFAGPTEQKLPSAAVSAACGANTGGAPDRGAKPSLAFSWHETPTEEVAIAALAAKAAGQAAPGPEAVPAATPAGGPLDRLEQMISGLAVTFRQADAQTLGVTLKVDAQTQLFLQLTTSNGQAQATVRCERGSFSADDSQWAQLQQSLARQNVQLLPLEGGSRPGFQQSPENPHRHLAATTGTWRPAGDAVQPAQPRKQREQNRPRKNWESWA
jgi:hypothetical protein